MLLARRGGLSSSVQLQEAHGQFLGVYERFDLGLCQELIDVLIRLGVGVSEVFVWPFLGHRPDFEQLVPCKLGLRQLLRGLVPHPAGPAVEAEVKVILVVDGFRGDLGLLAADVGRPLALGVRADHHRVRVVAEGGRGALEAGADALVDQQRPAAPAKLEFAVEEIDR